MLHSYVNAYIHFVWSTKNREPYLINEVRGSVHRHIAAYAQSREIAINAMGIQKEHLHALVTLRSDQKIDDIAKLLKGESSHWINSENLIEPKFVWQRGYGAFSISRSHLDTVKAYIKGQDEHHRRKSYTEEVEELLMRYGYDKNEINSDIHML